MALTAGSCEVFPVWQSVPCSGLQFGLSSSCHWGNKFPQPPAWAHPTDTLRGEAWGQRGQS